jgi:hypothetical protein
MNRSTEPERRLANAKSGANEGFVREQFDTRATSNANRGLVAQRDSPKKDSSKKKKPETKLTDRDWAINQALKDEPDYRDPRTQAGIPESILIYLPSLPKMGRGNLNPTEVEKRIQAVRKSIDDARGTMPFAASQMQSWLTGKGEIREINRSDLNVYDADRKILNSIVKHQKKILLKGVIDRFQVSHERHIKPGQTRKIYYQS